MHNQDLSVSISMSFHVASGWIEALWHWTDTFLLAPSRKVQKIGKELKSNGIASQDLKINEENCCTFQSIYILNIIRCHPLWLSLKCIRKHFDMSVAWLHELEFPWQRVFHQKLVFQVSLNICFRVWMFKIFIPKS